jgi:hypothetical protein
MSLQATHDQWCLSSSDENLKCHPSSGANAAPLAADLSKAQHGKGLSQEFQELKKVNGKW